MKYLIKDLGKDEFMELVNQERKALSYKTYPINVEAYESKIGLPNAGAPEVTIEDEKAFEAWKNTNVFPQKQKGLFAIGIKTKLGDFSTEKARKLAVLIKNMQQTNSDFRFARIFYCVIYQNLRFAFSIPNWINWALPILATIPR